MKVFFDADALFAADSSPLGPARVLISSPDISVVTSTLCIKEAAKALLIKKNKELVLNNSNWEIVATPDSSDKYLKFVIDKYDAHVVAAAAISKSDFLCSYNLRHFQQEKIMNELDITTYTPGKILFYLRCVKLID